MKTISLLDIFSICVLLTFSCSPSSEIKEGDFTEESFLKTFKLTDGIKYNSDQLILGTPMLIKFHPDSFLIFTDKIGKLIKVIDLKTRRVQELIIQGKGPGELLSVMGIEILSNDIYVFCPLSNKIIKIIEDTNREFKIDREIKLAERTTSFFPLKKDLFVCLSQTGDEKRVAFLNEKGEIIKKVGDYPPLVSSNDFKGDNSIFQSHIVASPDGKGFVLACSVTDILEIYDTEEGLSKRLQGPLNIKLSVERGQVDGHDIMRVNPMHSTYCLLSANEKEFWAGYVGYKFEKGKQSTLVGTSPKQIFCFDWAGHPLRRIIFDCVFQGFDIDWENKILYTIGIINNNSEIISYKISDIYNE